MKFKKRYKEGLKSFIKEMNLRIVCYEVFYLKDGDCYEVSYLNDGDRKYLGSIIENKHYYIGELSWKVCMDMLMEIGLKSRIEKLIYEIKEKI
jgi:hypothetical protein